MQEYEEWMKEKAPKRTSDDCHTPADVYECVAKWVSEEYHILRSKMCRPFYPGGDYESFDYTGKIVVDNPPFSILSKIIRIYTRNNINFFLFAPALTSFASLAYFDVCHIFVNHHITYANGVNVSTCFLTNLDHDILARSAQDLRRKLQECPSQLPKKKTRKIMLGCDEFHGAKLNTASGGGLEFQYLREDCDPIRKTREGQVIYGGGFRLKKGATSGRTFW